MELPEDIRKAAQAHVEAGHFPTVEDALRAGLDALIDLDAPAESDWLAYARNAWAEGVAELDAGLGIEVTDIDEFMAELDADVMADCG